MALTFGFCDVITAVHYETELCRNFRPKPEAFANGIPVAAFDAPPPQLTMEEFDAR